VYQIENSRHVIEARRRFSLWPNRWPNVGRTVVLLGLTSLLTDISAEMISTVLPLYLVVTLRLPPLQFGIIDGIYQGASVLVRLASGFVADRRRASKGVAVMGYALSALTKPGLLVAQGAAAFTGLIIIDRIGKGIRTAPRDAMISRSGPEAGLATAFGVHRAMDTAGAMLGPLIAFALLVIVPGSFDAVFVVSFCFALLGVAVIALFVREPLGKPSDGGSTPERISVGQAARLVHDASFSRLVVVGALLALTTVSDGFLYLVLQRQVGFSAGIFPLLFVGTALAFMVTAVPIGRLADRVGRSRVFVAGYVLLGIVYGMLLIPAPGPWLAVLVVVTLGMYYAMTDGVIQALASARVAPHLRGTGLGLLASATSVTRLLASVLFGLAWTMYDVRGAIVVFLAGLAIAICIGIGAFARDERRRTHV
jgi:MFS family permease